MIKLKVSVGGVSQYIPLDMVVMNEDGTKCKDYLDQVVGGKYVVDTVAVEAKFLEAYSKDVKATIEKAISTMRVEVDGLGYDGNEVATSRMQKAITTLVGDEKVSWRLYDNTSADVTQTELGKAMRAAGILMSQLWFCTSIEEVEEIVKADSIWYKKYEN